MLLNFTEWIRSVPQRQLERIIGTINFSFFLSLISVSLVTVDVEGFGCT
jgi:hypothetical protein